MSDDETEHQCTSPTDAHGDLVITGDRGQIDFVEFKIDSQYHETFECSCGEILETRQEAEAHVREETDPDHDD